MSYDKEIIGILSLAGRRGLSPAKIARHVHHEVNSLFEPIGYEEVYAAVRRFVRNNSGKATSALLRTKKRGYYRLNNKSETVRRLILEPPDTSPGNQ